MNTIKKTRNEREKIYIKIIKIITKICREHKMGILKITKDFDECTIQHIF